MKYKVLAIVGESGVGKTTIADILNRGEDFHMIKSYTTRHPRGTGSDEYFVIDDDEIDHIFVKDENYCKEDIYENWNVVAHTNIYDNHYWSVIESFDKDKINVYVIDPLGLEEMQSNDYFFDIVTVLVTSDKASRPNRVVIPDDFAYNFEFNNSNHKDTFNKIADLIDYLKLKEWL